MAAALCIACLLAVPLAGLALVFPSVLNQVLFCFQTKAWSQLFGKSFKMLFRAYWGEGNNSGGFFPQFTITNLWTSSLHEVLIRMHCLSLLLCHGKCCSCTLLGITAIFCTIFSASHSLMTPFLSDLQMPHRGASLQEMWIDSIFAMIGWHTQNAFWRTEQAICSSPSLLSSDGIADSHLHIARIKS